MPTPVSILMPCYNAERFLAEAVESVLAQTHGDFELLAIDDGSKDGTRGILESFAATDSRVKVIAHPNMGMGRSLNDAMERASHEWLARIDADDVMLPQRLERQLAFVAEHPSLVVASSLVIYIDESGEEIGRSHSNYTKLDDVEAAVKRGELIGFHHPAVLMKRDAIRAVGGYRHAFWPADDADLWNRVSERHPRGMLVQQEYLIKYRIHSKSVCVADAKLTAQKADWVETCMAVRRAGRPEPTWEQFLTDVANRPWLARMNRWRKDTARALYKTAAHHYSVRHFGRFVPAVTGAALLHPNYVMTKMIPGWGKRR